MASKPILFCDSASGVYIPQRFANEIDRSCVTGVSEKEWTVLENGPDEERYWEVWDDVETNAVITLCPADGGGVYYLMHDMDLWLIPADVDEDTVEADMCEGNFRDNKSDHRYEERVARELED